MQCLISLNLFVSFAVVWIQEINKAARGESLIEKPDYPALYELLGLDINDQPDAAEINRAYRKKALRCHPDKGGDMLEVRLLLSAGHHRLSDTALLAFIVQAITRCL